MKLSDFYFADRHAVGTKMHILLPSGKDSGEWLQVIGPDCDAGVRAGRAYTTAIRHLTEELAPLDKECEALNNWARYNDEKGWRVMDLNKQLDVDIVTGWSFDEPFSKEALANLFDQYSGLAEAVVKHHTDSREKLSEK